MARTKASTTRRRVRWLTGEEEQAWRAVGAMMHKLGWALECQLERDSDLSFIEYHTLARLPEEPTRTLRMREWPGRPTPRFRACPPWGLGSSTGDSSVGSPTRPTGATRTPSSPRPATTSSA